MIIHMQQIYVDPLCNTQTKEFIDLLFQLFCDLVWF